MKKILVIEDNAEVRENLEEILELSGYEVLTAEDGKLGVEIALKEMPDLVLCDVMMPRLDGFGVLNILSKKSSTADIPFVFLTAKTEKSDFRRGMNLGADDYVTKPFYKDELLTVIETRLRKSEQIRKKFDRTENGLSAFINEAKGYEELKKLSLERRVKHYKKREVIFEEGDYPRYLYFVNSGKVKVFKTNEDGKEYIIDIFMDGDFVGYNDLIRDSKYAEGASALEDTDISLIPREDFLALLHANRDVASQLIKMLAEIERRINEENARPKKRYISPSTREEVYAIYYDALRRKIEDRGTQKFPELAGKKLYGELTMIVTINHDGRVLDTEVVQNSGITALDSRAQAIARSAGPFGKFSAEMRKRADQIVVVSRFKFTREETLETKLTER